MNVAAGYYRKTKVFLEAIKFSHSIFALPFVAISTVLAFEQSNFESKKIFFIILCMVTARTFAMGVNRLADQHIDALNPRTTNRALPSQKLSTRFMFAMTIGSGTLFVVCCYFFSQIAFWCSLPLLLILGLYSYTKRVHWMCHVWLGVCLGLAPIASWVALRNGVPPPSILCLAASVCFWVAGFDVIYSLQDEQFDRLQNLKSIPARFGAQRALVISRSMHLLSLTFLYVFGVLQSSGTLYFVGFVIFALFIFLEHWFMRKGRLDKVQLAFFQLNGVSSVILAFFCILDRYFSL